MLASKKTRRGVIGAVVLAGALVMSGFAYTAAATIPDTIAGHGTSTVTTPNVAVTYVLDGTDKSILQSVGLTMSTALTTSQHIWLKLDSAGSWIDCGAAVAGTAQTCATTATVASINQAEVTVVDA
jgi:hypothetical protein